MLRVGYEGDRVSCVEGMGVGGGDVPLCFLIVLLAAAAGRGTAAFLLELLEAGTAEFFEVGVGHFGGVEIGLRRGIVDIRLLVL